ncbi:MAG: hypothetical protein J2P36_06905 [Ktedonobacteraceae bacterium]|nr:hypothetical protein [Ktedonobacteraceae bacterium]
MIAVPRTGLARDPVRGNLGVAHHRPHAHVRVPFMVRRGPTRLPANEPGSPRRPARVARVEDAARQVLRLATLARALRLHARTAVLLRLGQDNLHGPRLLLGLSPLRQAPEQLGQLRRDESADHAARDHERVVNRAQVAEGHPADTTSTADRQSQRQPRELVADQADPQAEQQARARAKQRVLVAE